MREIEFRLWCSNTDEYIEPEDVFFLAGELSKQLNECYTPEQYTGLEDKKGNKIFEGDIVKFYKYNYIIEDHRIKKSAIVFNKGCFEYEGMYDHDGCSLGFNDVEVIGNIHENPDLLEG